MVKEERSLRTRQWPVRSGYLRGARSEISLLPAAPLPRASDAGPGDRKHRLFANRRPRRNHESRYALSSTGPIKMPTATNPSRTALAKLAAHPAGITDFTRNRR